MYLEFNYDFEKAMTRCEPEKTKKERKKGRLSIKSYISASCQKKDIICHCMSSVHPAKNRKSLIKNRVQVRKLTK